MKYLFEDLIRRFSEISNEPAEEHFTPREVLRLIVDHLLSNNEAALTGTGIVRTVYDPACGAEAHGRLRTVSVDEFTDGMVVRAL
jgi:type I restriction enzyme M protein